MNTDEIKKRLARLQTKGSSNPNSNGKKWSDNFWKLTPGKKHEIRIVKYKHSEKQYFDLAGSKTYIMPDMREFTEGEYFHPFDVATIVGNPDLVNTIIYNFDLKYSYYVV